MRTVEAADTSDELDVEAVRDVLREHPVRLAMLFGSHATGTTHGRSDIDIAVEFDGVRPSDPEYNEVLLGLGADLGTELGTDDLDLVDIHEAPPAVTASILSDGVLLLGDPDRAAELRQRVACSETDQQSPRERLDAALSRIDAHLARSAASNPDGSESEG